MEAITIDGMHEDAFRLSVEDMLRRGRADEAAARLRTLIAAHAGEGCVLPGSFLSAKPEDIEISGWEALEEGLRKFDRAEQPVTAISISFGDPEGRPARPDATGRLAPIVETSYFSDEAFPFSESSRDDLLDGYSTYGCQWAGDCEGVDHALSFTGADDIYGALMDLEARLLSTSEPEPDDIRAGTIASCYLAVLFHQAFRGAAGKRQMGRPLCVLTANNGVYPSFDSPVLSCDEYLAGGEVVAIAAPQAAEVVAEECFAPAHAVEDEEGPEEASLLSIGIRRSAKQPVLALAEGDEETSFEAMAQAAMGGMTSLPPLPPAPTIVTDDMPQPAFEPEMAEAPEQPEEDVFDNPASFIEVREPADSPESEAETHWPADELDSPAEELGIAAPETPDLPITEISGPPAAPAEFVEAAELVPVAAEDQPDLPEVTTQQMGDTEWPEREEPIDQFGIDPVPLPGRPEARPAKRQIEPPARGHSLRARFQDSEELPEPVETGFRALVQRLLRMFRLVRYTKSH